MKSRQNVEEVMNIADIGVLATFTEGISNSILEFMALSKPVVVTGKGGCEELVVNNENGFLSEPGNYSKMAAQINMLLNDAPKRDKFGVKSREIVFKEFSQQKMIEQFIDIYSTYENN
jgi:glycosyltransferase involved in cell wall biosynthesis